MSFRIVIAGGAGFLGSHLCDFLISKGHWVLCLDNLLTGRSENIAHLNGHPRFSFVFHDVTHPIYLDRLTRDTPEWHGCVPDYIVNLASPASPKDFAQHSIHILKAGALGTLHCLGLAKAVGATFLVASSSEVYGDAEVTPQSESYWGHVNPVGPRSAYDEAKRFAEALTMSYHRMHGLKVRIARIHNTYGPRMRADDGRVIPSFMTQALRGDPLTVYGKGSQTRSFCYVDDLIDGLTKLLFFPEYEILNMTKDLPVFNLGNPDDVTVLQLAREVIEVTNSESKIVFRDLPVDDPMIRRPDIGKARRVLSWDPVVSRMDGLRRVIPYFASLLSEEIADRG